MRLYHFTSLALLALVSCASPATDKSGPESFLNHSHNGVSWGSSSLNNVGTSRTVSVSYEVPAGGGNLYYLFTNVNSAEANKVSLTGAASVSDPRSIPAGHQFKDLRAHMALRDKAAAAFRAAKTGKVISRAAASPPAPVAYAEGDSTTFWDGFYETNQDATLRKVVTNGGHQLNVWVADDAWDAESDGTPATPSDGLSHGVSQAMIDALADRFLKSEGTNDIYHWVTNVYGAEWPSSGAPTGYDSTFINSNGQIHIFLTNLNPEGTDNGVLMGYFYSVNNFLKSAGASVANSNEKILFALDADSLANPDDDQGNEETWDISDYWPAEIVSTLAHEFQHMIHFYEKQVVQDVEYSDAWIDEMTSMVTEDFVADRLGVGGPRGVLEMDTGASGNLNGRMPLFNYWHEAIPLTGWDNDSPLPNYSSAYAFGAWLLRNHGGPSLFHSLVNSPDIDYTAVVNAVRAVSDSNATWASLVRDWGLATFLGQGSTGGPWNYQAPTGGAFSWNYGSLDYQAGSIDPWNYRYVDGDDSFDGPWVYNTGSLDAGSGAIQDVAAGASYFYAVGQKSAGKHTETVNLPAKVVLSVVLIP